MDETISAYILEGLTCVTSILSVSICIYFLWHICYKSKDKVKNVDKKLLLITLVCFFSYTISCIMDIFSIYFDLISYQELPLLIAYYTWWCSWVIGKLSLYLVYIYRLYVTFKTSAFAYSVYKTYVPILFCWLLQAVNVIMSMIFGGSWEASNDTVLICETSILITDTILIIILLCLFLYPITKLMKTMEETSTKKDDVRATFKYSFVSQTELQSNMTSSIDLTAASETSIDHNHSFPTTIPSLHSIPSTPTAKTEDTENIKHQQSKPSTPTTPTTAFPDTKKVKSKRFKHKFSEETMKNKQYAKLLRTTTKAAILTMTALCTSFIYQLAWVITVSMNHRHYHFYAFGYTFSVDTVINMFCVLLTYPFAKSIYQKIFVDCCGIHDGIMQLIHKCMSK